MSNVHTKIIVILFILCSSRSAYSQLTLENIFLTDKYATKQSDDIEFLHTKPFFARLLDVQQEQRIAFYNLRNEKTTEWILPKSSAGNNKWGGLIMSNSDTYFLIRKDCEQLYRRSFYCNYYVGTEHGPLTPLSNEKQIYPIFSPDDKKIAFIKNNNIYYKEIASGNEIQITADGEWNKIINGKSDWVYEEELELTCAYQWNAKSDKIAYLKFDESNVKEYSIPMYYDMQYPNTFTYKYPKVGEENSRVSVWLYDLKSQKNKKVLLPFPYEYIPRIYWNKTGDEIELMLLNRHQDSLQLVGYNIKTKKTRQLYLETDNSYVEVPKTVQFLADNSFIINSEKDGFNHLYHYDKDGNLINQLTKGNFEITDVYGVDEKEKLVYYQSNEDTSNTNRNLFQINYEILEKKQLYDTTAGVTTARFSSDFSFYFRTYSNLKTPPIINVISTKNNAEVLLENNQFLVDSLLPLLPQKQIGRILAKNATLNKYDILPNDSIVHLSATIPQPTLFFVYGGPGNEEVINVWNSKSSNLFLYYLAQQGIHIVCIDPSGSGGQGAVFKKQTFLNLGKQETTDILEYAEFLKGNFSFDSSRLGIYGWSYGGFLAANCLLEGDTIFKTAIAGAPISNWNLYDNVYTEKYMRTPKENPKGYHSFNPNVSARKLQGDLLLIHGTADDNVHFQHTIQFINALNAANKTYQLYIYPDAMHSISGKKMRFDVYNKMYLFLKEKL